MKEEIDELSTLRELLGRKVLIEHPDWIDDDWKPVPHFPEDGEEVEIVEVMPGCSRDGEFGDVCTYCFIACTAKGKRVALQAFAHISVYTKHPLIDVKCVGRFEKIDGAWEMEKIDRQRRPVE